MPSMNGRFSAANVPLRFLIRMAYGVQDFQIIDGPSWQLSKKFDIQAKAEDGFKRPMNRLLQSLLADRFVLKVHTETRQLPVSSLVLARSDGKLGPDLKPSTIDCPDPQIAAQKMSEALAKGGNPQAVMAEMRDQACGMMPMMLPGPPGVPPTMAMRVSGQPISMLTQLLTQFTGRMVQDHTGLTGRYDYQIIMDPQLAMQAAQQMGMTIPAGVTMPPSNGPSLLTFLQEQLGLKIVTERGPLEVLVIDSAELPTPD